MHGPAGSASPPTTCSGVPVASRSQRAPDAAMRRAARREGDETTKAQHAAPSTRVAMAAHVA